MISEPFTYDRYLDPPVRAYGYRTTGARTHGR